VHEPPAFAALQLVPASNAVRVVTCRAGRVVQSAARAVDGLAALMRSPGGAALDIVCQGARLKASIAGSVVFSGTGADMCACGRSAG
jgi:hypothetical protein